MKFLLAFSAGCLYALTYPTLGPALFPLLFVALPVFLFFLEKETDLKHVLFLVFCYNLGLNVTGFYWIPGTLQEFGQLPYPVCVLLGLLFSFILQPHWWLYGVWKRYRPQWSWDSERGILVSAFILTFVERFFPQQFPIFVGSPWLTLAPYLGLTPYLGAVIFSFMTYWVSLELVSIKFSKKFRPLVWMSFTCFIILNAVLPMQKNYGEQELRVRIVQANIGNFMKISSEKGDRDSFESINDRYKRLSVENSEFKPDLIVWPETAYSESFRGKSRPDLILQEIEQETKAELLIGGYDLDPKADPFSFIETTYNSSVLIHNGQVKSTYHKNILIPFGETLPFGPLNRQIVSVVPAISLFARGHGTPLMETKNQQRFVTPICYEILETNYMRSLLNEHGNNLFIVNHTNDSWYGDTAEPHQHLFLSKWRALEFEMPIVRSTNTGITSIIYPDGSESKRLGIGEEAVLDEVVRLGSGEATFYQRYGMLPFLAVFLMILNLSWLIGRRPKR